MVRDLFPQDQAAKMLSLLITIMAIAPLIGPLAGGRILSLASWRAIFWLLVIIGVATLVALFTIPETLPFEQRTQMPLGQVFRGYMTLLRDPHMLAYAGIGGCFHLGIYAYIASTPFAYIDYYHVSPGHYGWLFGAGILGIMVANMVNAALSERFGSRRLMGIGTAIAAFAGILAAIAALTGWGGLFGLVMPLLVYCAAAGLIIANSIICALSRHPDRAGSASALVGAAHYGSGIAGSGLVGFLANGTPVPLGMMVALGGVGTLLCMGRLSLDTKARSPCFLNKE
jgi:DHA1 family bicyclomycin/chloramphenicol resistance-like MFS transporter